MKVEYLDKEFFACHYCKDAKMTNKIKYVTLITKSQYDICSKCFVREFGKDNLEKIKQKRNI